MAFNALFRLLGRQPGPLTDSMIAEAIERCVEESDDLDWKAALPPTSGLAQTDYPKDVAAMANSGGGVIVYGVEEAEKAATARRDVGDLTEIHERALRSAAVTAISPPVFGLEVYRLGDPGLQCVVVVVPPSVDGPHLIYRNDFFGAPMRNDADTVWMRERQIEARYRARFDASRRSFEALEALYDETVLGRDVDRRAWMIAVARPRLPTTEPMRRRREEVHHLLDRAGSAAFTYASRNGGVHPLDNVDRLNVRTGLRRWIAPNATVGSEAWKEAWISVHHDGSVAIAAAVGGHRDRDGHLPASRIRGSAIECVIADLMGSISVMAVTPALGEYEVRVGIEWGGAEPIIIQTIDDHGFAFDSTSLPLERYAPVTTTVVPSVDTDSFLRQVHDLAQDCVNQGGVSRTQLIASPDVRE